MSKAIAILPVLLLLVPSFLIATEVSARNFSHYYPLVGFLVLASVINLWMILSHRKRQERTQ